MDVEAAYEQIDAAIEKAEESLDRDYLTTRSNRYSEAITICAGVITRLTPQGSVYERQAKRILDRQGFSLDFYVKQLMGILAALRSDIENGYLQTFEEELHADVFGDFLQMADQLTADRYVLPAAVVAGAALEAHLRSMAERAGVTTTLNGKPKKASRLNDDLAKKEAYRKAEQKQVLAWQDLRNAAAHGDDDFTAQEVRLMIQGIRDFIARHPA